MSISEAIEILVVATPKKRIIKAINTGERKGEFELSSLELTNRLLSIFKSIDVSAEYRQSMAHGSVVELAGIGFSSSVAAALLQWGIRHGLARSNGLVKRDKSSMEVYVWSEPFVREAINLYIEKFSLVGLPRFTSSWLKKGQTIDLKRRARTRARAALVAA